jgi:hypothetical protein
MNRLEEFKQRQKNKKEETIKEFLNNINKLHDNSENIVVPSIGIMKENKDKFIDFHVTRYPNCFKYSITFYKKDYPFDLYYSKDFFKDELPKKYIKIFTELENKFC